MNSISSSVQVEFCDLSSDIHSQIKTKPIFDADPNLWWSAVVVVLFKNLLSIWPYFRRKLLIDQFFHLAVCILSHQSRSDISTPGYVGRSQNFGRHSNRVPASLILHQTTSMMPFWSKITPHHSCVRWTVMHIINPSTVRWEQLWRDGLISFSGASFESRVSVIAVLSKYFASHTFLN